MKTGKVNQKGWLTAKLLLIALTVFTSSLIAFGQGENTDKSESPYFLVKSKNPDVDKLPLLSTSADVKIAGVIADVTIYQVYKNDGQHPLEAIYVFPASAKAAVYAMEMKIGNRTVIAKIEEKKKARRDYEEAVKQGRRASLLEQLKPNVFKMNVGNIMPGDVIEVSLKYTELLVPEEGIYSFVYPTVVGPRFMYDGGEEISNENYDQPSYQNEGDLPYYDFDINIQLSTGIPIQNIHCPSHKVVTNYDGTSTATIYLDNLEIRGGNRDFILDYQLAGKQIQSGLLLYEHGDENFFLMMVQPPKRITPEKIPPREYIFIVDVSGSMFGFPLETSKTLLRNLVLNLKPTDRFNVLLFAGTSGWLSEKSVLATKNNIDKAIRVIDNQRGSGSTMLLPALRKALNFPRQDKSLSRSFVIVTDGYVSVEKEAINLIREHANEANTFAFGIGSGVNRYIIEGIAHAGMGEPAVVTKPGEASEIAENFRKYISSPVLTQITTGFGSFDVYDVEPVSVPDVLAERPVIIFGKYRGQPKGEITVRGNTGDGKYEVVVDVDESVPDENNSAIRYLWARKRIQLLDDYRKMSYDNSKENEILDLGLKYNLMTAYTSFVAIDNETARDENGNLITVEQPLPLPEGVSNYAVGCEMEVAEVVGINISKSYTPKHNFTGVKVTTSLKGEQNSRLTSEIKSLIELLKKSCKITSKTLITLRINNDGTIAKIKIHSQNNSEIEDCIKQEIMTWSFSNFQFNDTVDIKVKM